MPNEFGQVSVDAQGLPEPQPWLGPILAGYQGYDRIFGPRGGATRPIVRPRRALIEARRGLLGLNLPRGVAPPPTFGAVPTRQGYAPRPDKKKRYRCDPGWVLTSTPQGPRCFPVGAVPEPPPEERFPGTGAGEGVGESSFDWLPLQDVTALPDVVVTAPRPTPFPRTDAVIFAGRVLWEIVGGTKLRVFRGLRRGFRFLKPPKLPVRIKPKRPLRRPVVPRKPNPAKPFPARPRYPTPRPKPAPKPPPVRVPRKWPLPVEHGPLPAPARTPTPAPASPTTAPAPGTAPQPQRTQPRQPGPTPQPATQPLPLPRPAGDPGTQPAPAPAPAPQPAPAPAPQRRTAPAPWPWPAPAPAPGRFPWPAGLPGIARPFLRRPRRLMPRLGRSSLTDIQADPLPFAQPQPQPQPRTGDCVCTDTKPRKKKRRERVECRRGTYTETRRGLIKRPRERITCK